MFLIALISLSEVPTLKLVSSNLSAVNCSSFGIINLVPCTAIFNPRSSMNAAMSINACSKEVSFKSAAVESSFLKLPPPIVGWSVAQSFYRRLQQNCC